MYGDILYEVTGATAIITLNRPEKLNAWTERMGQEVEHAFAQAEADERVVGIVLTGAGRAFCAGADMQLLSNVSAGTQSSTASKASKATPAKAQDRSGYRATYTYMASLRKPVIAAINGACAGMALPIACFCDLRFASDSASFHSAFARRGLIAEWGVSWILPRLCGPANAFDMLCSGRKVEAAEALRMGLVNRVLPTAELLSAAKQYVEDLAQNAAPSSIATIKRQIYDDLLRPLGDALDVTMPLMLRSFGSADFREGVAAYMEKRPPQFSRVGGAPEEPTPRASGPTKKKRSASQPVAKKPAKKPAKKAAKKPAKKRS